VGSVPVMSRLTRRRNSSSVDSSDGTMPSFFSLAATNSSIGLAAGKSMARRPASDRGTRTGTLATSPPKVTMTAVSPGRPAMTSPVPSVVATASSLDVNWVRAVTSSAERSE
jgi:hypothetical protein